MTTYEIEATRSLWHGRLRLKAAMTGVFRHAVLDTASPIAKIAGQARNDTDVYRDAVL